MKKKLSLSNPFPINAKSHFWEVLNEDGTSELHLDFGSHDGKAIAELVKSGVVKKAIGLDANSEVVKKSQGSLPANVELCTITEGEKIPFPDETFTSVSLFGVLEHVLDQDKLLRELNRVTKKGGFFVLPICYWTDEDVWEFHRIRNLPHCSLYDEGFKRLGCVGCPLGSNRERDFQRWPRIHKLWLSAFDKFLKKWKGKKNNNGAEFWFEKYETPEQFFQWWMEDQGDGPACQGAELFSTHELGDENANDE